MKKIKYIILSFGIVAGFGLAALPVAVSAATNPFADACKVDPNSAVCKSKDDSVTSFTKIIVNTLLYVLGAISVIVIIIGGIRYTISMGDAKNVEAAKSTILYAVVGLVVAILAYAIVNFVLGVFK